MAGDTADAASLPYHEPGIVQILILSSFFLALNVINSVLDRTLYCGLIGQVLVGIAWGTPGAGWLSTDLEHAVVQIGYLGLIMIVYEGGVSTSISAMKANLLLSIVVAATGIAVPMGLSFILGPMVGATPIQCFAAGAALCSTSLGTTFTVLSTSGLVSTRLGSVLSTAAMMDDVIGLVMVQIVSSLGGSGSGEVSIEPVTVIRPIFVSLAFAILIPLANRFVLRPAMRVLDKRQETAGPDAKIFGLMHNREAVFVLHTGLILGLVAGAAYAGASVLLAAYLAGVMVCWWDAERVSPKQKSSKKEPSASSSAATPQEAGAAQDGESRETASDEQSVAQPDGDGPHAPVSAFRYPRHTGVEIYEDYYVQAINRVLKPFFFASIGFSIPITQMFDGPVVWRGIIYTILMMIGKVMCGLWLVRFPRSPPNGSKSSSGGIRGIVAFFPAKYNELATRIRGWKAGGSGKTRPRAGDVQGSTTEMSNLPAQEESATSASPAKPTSLYPAGIISFAMVARGEIGFLISAVAESNGIFRSSSSSSSSSSGSSELFLIVTWAIVLCTVIGPVTVGVLVKRVKRLEKERAVGSSAGSHAHVLGAWGVA